MKKEQIQALFAQFENACYDYKGIECWSARELQQILGYAKWDNFKNAVDKAKKACENAGLPFLTILLMSGKWSVSAVARSAKLRTSYLQDMPVI